MATRPFVGLNAVGHVKFTLTCNTCVSEKLCNFDSKIFRHYPSQSWPLGSISFVVVRVIVRVSEKVMVETFSFGFFVTHSHFMSTAGVVLAHLNHPPFPISQ